MTCSRLLTLLKVGLAASLLAGSAKAVEATAPQPSYEGVWQIQTAVRTLKASDGQVPPLNAAARKLYMQRVAKFRAGDAPSFDQSLDCQPIGEPRAANEGQPFEIVQGEHALFIGYARMGELRIVYLNTAHDASVVPSYYGSWTGEWDGTALVLEGVGFRDNTLLDAAGMPHSESLHLVQHLSLNAAGTVLTIRTTFQDSKTFTRVWTAKHSYRRLPDAYIQQAACQQRAQPTRP